MKMPSLPRNPAVLIVAGILLCLLPCGARAAEGDAASAAARKATEPASASAAVEARTSAVPAEADARMGQQMIDQLRREIESSIARNAEAVTTSLSQLEPALARMHERQVEAMQNSNRILIVAGVFAAIGLLGLILISLILVRAIGRFTELAVTAPSRGHLLGAGQPVGILGDGTGPGNGAAEQASQRFQGALDQLQRRIMELEHSAQPAPGSGNGTGRVRPEAVASTLNIEPLMPDAEPTATNGGPTPASRTSVLLGKGQALLNLDSVEPALQCFDEVLALEPNHAEALVKKGMAYEKLQDWERALESYDRAISADAAMTVAYLYRGGVCNRLQRYREALDSYEQALRMEKSSRAS